MKFSFANFQSLSHTMLFYISTIFLVFILTGILTHAEPLTGNNVTRVKKGKYSNVVSIAERSNGEDAHFCTGVLITNKFVLTAAHCLEGRLLNKTRLVVGSVDRLKGKKFEPIMWITYDEWAKSKNITKQDEDNDIAIIKLTHHRVNVVPAKPASLSFVERNYDYYDEHVSLVGWGITNDSPDRPSRYLHKAKVRVLPNAACEYLFKSLLKQKLFIHEKFLCTKGQPDAFLADGDSGGPVLRQNSVVGINRSTCPRLGLCDSPEEVINDHKFNLHIDINYFQEFINDVLKNY